MHLPPTAILYQQNPTISVDGTEVPLPTYFQVLDSYTAGHNIDSIIVHIVATTSIPDIDGFRETIQQIILNQQLIQRSSLSISTSESLTSNSNSRITTLKNQEHAADRRNSRIEFVGELDDLSSVNLIAGDHLKGGRDGERNRKEKEKEKGNGNGSGLKGILAQFVT